MSVVLQMQSICRTCMTKDVPLTSLFNPFLAENVETTIKDVLPLCASVQIYSGDGLPDCICVPCIDELRRAYLFRLRCEKSDSTLRGELVLLKQEPQTSSDTVYDQPELFMVTSFKVDSEELYNDSDSHDEDSEFGNEQNSEGVFKKERNSISDNNFEASVSDQAEFVCAVNYCETSINPSQDVIEKDITTDIPHTCTKCKRSFATDVLLRKHTASHWARRTHQCDVCGKVFARKDRLGVHMMRHTGEEGKYECPTCGRKFATAFYLKNHERYHTSEKPYLCNVCGRRFHAAPNLAYHLTTHIPGPKPKPHECEKCGKHFSSKLLLSMHMRTHNSERSVKCDICGKVYKSGSALSKHKKTHGQVKPYQCDMCEKRFFDKCTLVYHRRTHTGEKPYECKVCGEHFVSRGVLAKHMMTHTGEKPYICEHCGQSFRQRGTLGTHRKRVHKLTRIA